MGKIVLKDGYAVINGTNLSDHIEAITLTVHRDQVETTAMGSGGHEFVSGLPGDMVEFTVQSDMAAASVDAVISPLVANGTEFQVEFRVTSAAVSATNPKWTGTCLLTEYSPLDGKVGDLMTSKLKIPVQRAGLTRAVA